MKTIRSGGRKAIALSVACALMLPMAVLPDLAHAQSKAKKTSTREAELESRVNQDWFSLTVTGKARSAIRRHLRQREAGDFIKLGKTAVERAAAQVEKALKDISWRPAFERFNVTTEDELFELVGRGKIFPAKVLEAIFPGLKLPMMLTTDSGDVDHP